MSGTILPHVLPSVLVLGADRELGRGVVAAAAIHRPIIVAGTDADALEALRRLHPDADMTLVAGNSRTDADASALADAVRALDRPLAAVIAAIVAPSLRGRVLDQPVDALREALDQTLIAHIAAARHRLPLLKRCDRSGGYVMLGGPGGRAPWAGYGHRSVANAALRMLAQVLHNEAMTQSLRLQLLCAEDLVGDDSQVYPDKHPRPDEHTHSEHAQPERIPTARVIGSKALSLALCDRCTEATRAVVDDRAHAPACTAPPSAHRAMTEARALLCRVPSSKKTSLSPQDPLP